MQRDWPEVDMEEEAVEVEVKVLWLFSFVPGESAVFALVASGLCWCSNRQWQQPWGIHEPPPPSPQ